MIINNVSKIRALMLAALWTVIHIHLHEPWPRLKRIKLIVIDPVDEDILFAVPVFHLLYFIFVLVAWRMSRNCGHVTGVLLECLNERRRFKFHAKQFV